MTVGNIEDAGNSGTSIALGNKTLTVNSTSTGSYAGAIQDGGLGSGTGARLVKKGNGTLTLTGASTYTGATTVSAGNLKVNGSLTSAVTVNPGAVLSGIGTIQSIFVGSGGTVQPGNSIGTLTTGHLEVAGTYNEEINAAGQSSLMVVSSSVPGGDGVAIIDSGSTFNIIVDPGSYSVGQQWTIITADGGVTPPSMPFPTVTSTMPSFTFSVEYLANSVLLDLVAIGAVTPALDPDDYSGNAKKAAVCFLALPVLPFTDEAAIISALESLSIPGQQKAFNHMSPAQFSALTLAQENNAILVRSSYTRHLRDLHTLCCRSNEEQNYNLWFDGIGQWVDQDRRGQEYGFDMATGGATLGADYFINDIFALGLAASYTGSYLKWDSSAGNAHIKSYYGGLYSTLAPEHYYLDLALLGASNHYKVDRHIPIDGLSFDARHKNTGYEILASADYGYKFFTPKYLITPFLRVDYVYLHQKGYREHGAGVLDLNVHHKNTQWMQGELGVRGSRCIELCSGANIIPELLVGYINQTALTSKTYRASFVDADVSCVINSAGNLQEKNLFDISLATTFLSPCELVTLTARYDAQIGHRYTVQDVSLNLDFKF
jgi:subtilase-type serine protease